jgi:hypothetical protein
LTWNKSELVNSTNAIKKLIDMMPDNNRHLLEIAGTAGNLISAPGDDKETSTRRLGAGLLSMAIVLIPISLRERTGGILREDTLDFRRELP